MRIFTLAAGGAAILAGIHFSSAASLNTAPRTSRQAAVASAKMNGSRLMLSADQKRAAALLGGFVVTPQSLLEIRKPMRHGEFVWNDQGVPAGPVSVRIDVRTQILSVFRGGHEIGTAVVLYGADSKETPIGRFPVLWKGKNHRSSVYDAPMPFTLRLTGDGVAIHGSDVRWGKATHGCVGIPTEFARRLYDQVSVGDMVSIIRSKPSVQA